MNLPQSVKVELVKREFVEDGRKILEVSKKGNAALVCSGDPMVATTHQELRTRAIKEGIDTKILHGSSILCSVSGELGLHSYNFGRIVTITREPLQVHCVQHDLRQPISWAAYHNTTRVGRIS